MYTDYDGVVDFVRTNGRKVGPRGKMTYEVIAPTISMPADMYIRRARGNTRLIAVETMMLLGGFFDIEPLRNIVSAKSIALFEKQSDYGPRVRQAGNLDRAIHALLDDEHTRRAIVYFNSPDQPFDDLACTTSMQFLVRDKKINALVTMRSWDIVYGMPADLFMFANLLQYVSRLTRAWATGDVIVQAGSMHMYEDTEEFAHELSIDRFTTNFFYRSGEPNFYYEAVSKLSDRSASPDDYWNFERVLHAKPIYIGGI